jgi:hypothetical protein
VVVAVKVTQLFCESTKTVQFEFSNPVFEWRGPSPFYFVALSAEVSAALKELAPALTFGWGMIPGAGRIGQTEFTTALFPKDGAYLIPLRNSLRKAENIQLGERVSGTLIVGL